VGEGRAAAIVEGGVAGTVASTDVGMGLGVPAGAAQVERRTDVNRIANNGLALWVSRLIFSANLADIGLDHSLYLRFSFPAAQRALALCHRLLRSGLV
jgi:hypothetical protein